MYSIKVTLDLQSLPLSRVFFILEELATNMGRCKKSAFQKTL